MGKGSEERVRRMATYLVNHVTLWVPVFVLAVTINLDKLLQDRRPTSCTLDGVVERIVIVTVDLAIMFVIGVLGTKDCWAYRTCEVLNVIFVVQRRDIGATKSSSTRLAHKVESPEIVALTEWILLPIGLGDGEKLGRYNLPTVLREYGWVSKKTD